MSTQWPSIWKELLLNLQNQTKCHDHPEYPLVATLSQKSINDIIKVNDEGIVVRAHRTMHDRLLNAKLFQKWWSHLINKKTASLKPGNPNNPDPIHSCIVGAILVVGLPGKISQDKNDQSVIRILTGDNS